MHALNGLCPTKQHSSRRRRTPRPPRILLMMGSNSAGIMAQCPLLGIILLHVESNLVMWRTALTKSSQAQQLQAIVSDSNIQTESPKCSSALNLLGMQCT